MLFELNRPVTLIDAFVFSDRELLAEEMENLENLLETPQITNREIRSSKAICYLWNTSVHGHCCEGENLSRSKVCGLSNKPMQKIPPLPTQGHSE